MSLIKIKPVEKTPTATKKKPKVTKSKAEE